MNANNTPIAVTGAAGLAGSAVVDHLRSQLYTCVMPITRQDADLTHTGATRALFSRIKPVHVFHAAATVYGLGGNMANQAKSFLDNTLINTNVIDAAYRAGVKKITVMGTNAIYPVSAELPYSEEDIFNGRPHSGESAYGHAKRGMLAMLEAYADSYGIEYAYLVSGNLYGPGDKFDPVNGHVIPSLIWKFHNALTTGGDVELWGDGSPQRDFLYSKDLARIVESIMLGPTQGPINIGYGESCSIANVASLLGWITGLSPTRIKFDASKPNGRMNTVSDLTRFRDLRFLPIPKFSLGLGLEETWNWYCERHPLR
jgi:GDP-L-fucose synthase